MPKVPMLGGQQVSQAPLPGAKLTADPSPDAFGGGVAEGLQHASNVVLGIMQDEAQKAGEVAVMNALTQARRKSNALTYGEGDRTGLKFMKGETLFAAVDPAKQEFSDYLSELRANLGSDDQRLAFDKHAQNEQLNFEEFAQNHVATERADYEDKSLADFTKEYQDSIAQDAANGALSLQSDKSGKLIINDVGYQRNLETQELALRAYAARNRNRLGMDEGSFIKHGLQQIQSDSASAALQALLARGDDQTASEFFAKRKNELLRSERNGAQKAIDNANLVGEATRQSDALFAGNYSELAADPKFVGPVKDGIGRTYAEQEANAVAAARATVPEGKLQDAVVGRIRDRFTEADQTRTAARSEKFASLQQLIAGGASEDQISKNPWVTQLDGPQQASLSKMIELRSKGLVAQTQDDIYYKWKNMAANPATRADFLKSDLNLLIPDLSEKDWNFLSTLQKAGNKGNVAAFKGLMTDHQMVSAAIDSLYGIANTDRKHDKGIEFQRQLDDLIEAELANQPSKKMLSYKEKRGLIEGLTAETQWDKWGLWTGNKRVFDVTPEDVQWSRVPTDVQEEVEARISSNAQPITDETRKSEYILWLRTKGLRDVQR